MPAINKVAKPLGFSLLPTKTGRPYQYSIRGLPTKELMSTPVTKLKMVKLEIKNKPKT